jgi:hypothetical protein
MEFTGIEACYLRVKLKEGVIGLPKMAKVQSCWERRLRIRNRKKRGG